MAGQGFATGTADAMADLVAALARGDLLAETQAEASLHRQLRGRGIAHTYANFGNRIRAQPIFAAIRGAQDAVPRHGRGHPDVLVTTQSGDQIRVEIKAQLEKENLDDIAQVDWVRRGTDTLAWFAQNEPVVQGFLRPRNLAQLQQVQVPQGWSWQELWLADLGLVPNLREKAAHQVGPADLSAWLAGYWYLQIVRRTEQSNLLGQLAVVQEVLACPSALSYSVTQGWANEVQVNIFRTGGSGQTVFVYYVYPWGSYGNRRLFGVHKAFPEALR